MMEMEKYILVLIGKDCLVLLRGYFFFILWDRRRNLFSGGNSSEWKIHFGSFIKKGMAVLIFYLIGFLLVCLREGFLLSFFCLIFFPRFPLVFFLGN